MPRALISALLLLCSWCYPASAIAWNATGHQLVAIIAYAQLDEKTRATVDQLLSHRFVAASTWADEFKARDVRLFDEWHYINEPPNAQNVVWVIEETEAILQSKKPHRSDRIFALRWLIHAVGDVHQPLHTTSRHGDRGGNGFELTGKYGNLHAFWDAGAERFVLPRAELKPYAQQLMQQYPPQHFKQSLAPHPHQWAKESRALATTVVYEGIEPRDNPAKKPQYLIRAQHTSEQQIVLAGYRLANQLHCIYRRPGCIS